MADHYRQGDRLIVRVDEIPAEATVQHSPVVYEGKLTGHTHKLPNGEVKVVAETSTGWAASSRGIKNRWAATMRGET